VLFKLETFTDSELIRGDAQPPYHAWRGERPEETALVPVLKFVSPVSHFALAVYFSLRTLCQVGDPAPGVRYRDSCRLAEGQFSP